MASAVVSWEEGESRRVATTAELLAATAEAGAMAEAPVIVSVEAEGGTLTVVAGDPTGSTLVYFPAGYEQTGLGSLHSVGDRAARDANGWEPPQAASFFGHESEFPRWSVVPADQARQALREFFESNGQLPSNVEWELD